MTERDRVVALVDMALEFRERLEAMTNATIKLQSEVSELRAELDAAHSRNGGDR